MTRDEIIRRIKSFNSSLDVQFLESLSQLELTSYEAYLKALKGGTERTREHAPARTASD
ncbi:MAG TPA: hypothetical protein VMZ92_15090 [Planctomycetota bacterium]|nr:hypothetical protein [Planctomycetota bacterium]